MKRKWFKIIITNITWKLHCHVGEGKFALVLIIHKVKKNHCFETWDSVAYMPFNCRESPKYGTNLVNFLTGYQISQIKSIFELFCAWNLAHFSPQNLDFFIDNIERFLGDFCRYLVTDIDYFIITMMKADFNSMYFTQDFIWWLGHFLGGGVEVVGLLTFGGGAGVWCKI